MAESGVLDSKEELILSELRPRTLTADDAYTKPMRIRRWAAHGVLLTQTIAEMSERQVCPDVSPLHQAARFGRQAAQTTDIKSSCLFNPWIMFGHL